MNRFKLKAAGCVFALAAVAAPSAQAGECQKVSGVFREFVVSPFLSQFDPFGRVANFANGTINSVGTAVLTSVQPGPGGPPNWTATTRHVFVVSERDQLVATGVAEISPVLGSQTDVNDTLTLTVNGTESLGKYAGATGTIVMRGIGKNFYGPFPFPGPAAGSANFEFHYKGEVCFP